MTGIIGSRRVTASNLRTATGNSQNGACRLTEFTVQGNTRTEVMVCGKKTIKHSTNFRGDTFETTGTETTAEGVKSSFIKGRRLGDCPAGGAK